MKIIRGWSVVYVSMKEGDALHIHPTKEAAKKVIDSLRNMIPGREDLEIRPVTVVLDEPEEENDRAEIAR